MLRAGEVREDDDMYVPLIKFMKKIELEKNKEPIPKEEPAESTESIEESTEAIETPEQERERLILQADTIALSYDYDAAIELIQSYSDYESYEEMTQAIANYETQKASCIPVNLEEVTHIFYHSLVVDPIRCFGNQEHDPQCIGNNQWMTTISEFNKITQEMYDRGYVLVSIHDLYNYSVDENGNEIIEPVTIMLPEGKKAFVLSIDDLSYYHSYDNFI